MASGACTSPRISRLDYAPHRVWLEPNGDGFRPTGFNDLLDDVWRETDTFWCHGCDTELEGEAAALAHVAEARMNRLVGA